MNRRKHRQHQGIINTFIIDPDLLPKIQVDRGAIKFVLSGANIMCPGLTSKGARMEVDLPTDSVVTIMAEGKEHALAIGLLKMSTEDM
jgi:PUA domain protein